MRNHSRVLLDPSSLFLVFLCVLCVSVVSSGCSNKEPAAQAQPAKQPAPPATKAGPDQPVRVKVVRAERAHLKRVSTQPAHVEPYEKADLLAKVAGYLQKIHVDIGDRVKKDQVLAKLWVPELEQERLQKQALVEQARSALGQAEAGLTAAQAMTDAAKAKVEEARATIARQEAELAFRQVEHERYQRLVRDRSVQKDLADEKLHQYRAAEAGLAAAKAALGTAEANVKVEQARLVKARADVASAKAQVQVAQANLELAVILLNYGRIRAPYDGVITRRLVDPGAFIQSAAAGKPDPLFTLARVDRLRIITDIPEADAGRVQIGQPAVLQVDAARGQQLAGKVTRFADALDPATRTMRTEIELDAPPAALRPGMFGSVSITLADDLDALLLSTSALLAAPGKPAVMIVEGGRARRREIELGFNDGIRVQIIRGLSGSEEVLADGKNAVQEGQAVEIAK